MTQHPVSKIEKTLLMILGPLMLLGPLSVDMYVPFMPELAESFKASPSLIQMTITIPLLVMGFGQIFWGVVCDRVGRVQALYANLSLYIISCIACFYFHSIEYFIAARIFQAFAVCGGQVMTLSLVRDLTDGQQTQRLFSRLLGISGTAPIFAPYLGALLSDMTGSWRAIFIFLSCYTLMCVLMLSGLPHKHINATRANDNKAPFSIKNLLNDMISIISTPNFRRWSVVPILVMIGLFLFVAMSTHYLQVHAMYSKHAYAVVLALNSLCFLASSFAASYVNAALGDHRSISLGLTGIMFAQALQALYWFFFGQAVIVVVASIFASSICYGLIYGAGMRLTLDGFGANTGLATSLLGFLQFALASLVTTLVVHPPVHSPISLISVLFLGALIAFVHTTYFVPKNTCHPAQT